MLNLREIVRKNAKAETKKHIKVNKGFYVIKGTLSEEEFKKVIKDDSPK